MNEELETLKDVALRLNRAGIPYMVTGSFAMALHSIPRMTRDIDIVVFVAGHKESALIDAFKEGYYMSESAVHEAFKNGKMFNIINDNTVVKVDLIVKAGIPSKYEGFSRKKEVDIDGMAVAVASKEDLILAKLEWFLKTGSEMQEKDLRSLLASGCDLDYIRNNLASQETKDALARILENA